MENVTHISLDVERDLDTWEDVVEPKRGSRPKLILKRRTDGAYFVFKRPKDQREHQIWSELFGSFIAGDLLGWEVQHTALGIRHGSPGNLLRYIYGAGSEEQFIEGWELCKEIDPGFDVDKGRFYARDEHDHGADTDAPSPADVAASPGTTRRIPTPEIRGG